MTGSTQTPSASKKRTEMRPDHQVDSTSDQPASAPPRFWIAITGLMLVLALSTLDSNIVGPALPQIASDVSNLNHLSWIMTAFVMTATSATPLYGKLSDMYGRKPLFFAAVLLFLAGSAFCGTANDLAQLVLGRAIQGIGGGGLMTLTQITMSDLVPPSRRGNYQGLFGAIFAVCSVVGPPLGGLITEELSWRWIFYVNIPVGVFALWLIAVSLPPGRKASEHTIDYLGAFLMTTGTACVLLVLSLGGSTYAWTSPLILGLAGAAVAVTFLLLRVEARSKEPLIPLDLFRNSVFLTSALATAAISTAVFGALAFLPLYLQVVLACRPAQSGLVMSPMVVGLLLALLGGGRLVSATGRYKIFAVTGIGIATLSLLFLQWVVTRWSESYIISIVVIFLGFGLGLVMPSLTVALQNAVNQKDIGAATSTSNFLRSLGGAFGVAAAGAMIAAHIGAIGASTGHVFGHTESLGVDAILSLPEAARALVTESYREAIGATILGGAVIGIVAFVTVLFLPEQPLRTTIAQTAPSADDQHSPG